MKKIIITILICLSVQLIKAQNMKTFYDYTVTSLDGQSYPLSQLKGKKVLVVNVASKCGNTPQYKALQEIYDKYKSKNFVIVGFPSNDFASQEPGTDKEIREFCTKNYGVTFPMMSKIDVKGNDMAPVYKWLTSKNENGQLDSEVHWNFQKYLIDEKGNLVKMVMPKEKPDSETIISWIEGKN